MKNKLLDENNKRIHRFGYKFIKTKDGLYLVKNGFRPESSEKIDYTQIEKIMRERFGVI